VSARSLSILPAETIAGRPATPTSALTHVEITPKDAAEFFDMLDEAWRRVVADPDVGRDIDESEHPMQRKLRRGLSRTGKALAGGAVVLARVSLLVTLIEKHRPANWGGFASYQTAIVLMRDGFPVAWVPDADTLAALAEAPDRAAQQALLVERRDAVLAHAAGVLAEVSSIDLRDPRALVEEAVACVTSFPYAAQSLALHAATVVALEEMGMARLFELRGDLDEHIALLQRQDHQRLATDLRKSLLLLTVAPALRTFRPWCGDPIPTRPNRHAVAHSASLVQFTEANALESVLLAVSVLRQAEAARADQPARAGIPASSGPAGVDEG